MFWNVLLLQGCNSNITEKKVYIGMKFMIFLFMSLFVQEKLLF